MDTEAQPKLGLDPYTNFYIILFQGQLIDDIHEATLTAQIEKNPKDGF